MKHMYAWCSLIATLFFGLSAAAAQNLTVEGRASIGNNGDDSDLFFNAANNVSGFIRLQDDSFAPFVPGFTFNVLGQDIIVADTAKIFMGRNVGIGTSSPATKLQVVGTARASILQSSGMPVIDGQGAYLGWNRDGSKGRMLLANQKGLGVGGFEFITYDNANAIVETPMLIDEDGNVGIGITNPSNQLHILAGEGDGINLQKLAGTDNQEITWTDEANVLKASIFYEHSQGKINIYNTGARRMVIASNGSVGINTLSPTKRLDVNGQARIRILPSGSGSTVVADANGNLFVSGSSPNANERRINDLEADNEALKAELDQVKQQMTTLQQMVKNTMSDEMQNTVRITSATLQQNAPNPFTEATNINYFIPESVKSANLQVMDQNGRIIKTIPIQATGKGQITLQTNLLSAGTYSYSLVLDGQVMETKQMVLTH